MTEHEQTAAIKEFANEWRNHGDEKSETFKFWISLLRILGVEEPDKFFDAEQPIKINKHTCWIDIIIPKTKVLIEQKSFDVDLDKPIKQSDGIFLTPFEQAKRYAEALPYLKKPRWIVTCNFKELRIYDMLSYELYEKFLPYFTENQHKFKLSEDVRRLINRQPIIILVERLVQEYSRLNFLVDPTDDTIKIEAIISTQAGEVIGDIRKAIEKGYQISKVTDYKRDLNRLCVQLLFCLYAEDSNVFHKNQFHDYLKSKDTGERLNAISNLFKILSQPKNKRDPNIEELLKNFPYVNGGLFVNESLALPKYTDDIDFHLISTAMNQFNWRIINPTIFGAMFESILDDDVRRAGGMHYTSVANIHKVIDPLFLDDLKIEFDSIKHSRQNRFDKLNAFHDKLASLKFFDPACGSGNFLTETYLSLRQLENEVIREINKGNANLMENPIKVSINQFYGIEINDFAVAVAQTAMWIAENQMLQETEMIIHKDLNFLPLKNYATIVQGNALRMDWKEFAPAVDYIIGNPPFAGRRYRTPEQIKDVAKFFNYKDIDYVACWYKKAAKLIQNTKIRCAFVSTNSITQGEQVTALWRDINNIQIDFAYRTFKWTSESYRMAAVHCVIIGFSFGKDKKRKTIFIGDNRQIAKNINGYLIDAPNVFIMNRTKPICNVPEMRNGNVPLDGDALKIEVDDYNDFIKNEPSAKKFIKRLIGGRELIHGELRYVLWLVDANPEEYINLPLVMRRIEQCKLNRLAMKDPATKKLAKQPTTFRDTLNPRKYIAVPMVSSENRKYIPMAYFGKETIPTNQVQIIPNASLYHFGILTSSVHMAWVKTICGRLKSDYRYSKEIVYNNFPWPKMNETKRLKIEETAAEILAARAHFPDCSLAELYGEKMPKRLREAHRKNDLAVMEAYKFNPSMSEAEIVAALMKMYQKLVDKIS